MTADEIINELKEKFSPENIDQYLSESTKLALSDSEFLKHLIKEDSDEEDEDQDEDKSEKDKEEDKDDEDEE